MRYSRFFLLPMAIAVVAVSCSSNRGVSPTLAQPVFRQMGARFEETIRELVRDSARWQAVWDSGGGAKNAPVAPTVDFKTEMLVVAIGPMIPDSDSLMVDSLVDSGGIVRGRLTTYQNCTATQWAAVPIDVVKIPRSNSRLALTERTVRNPKNCVG